MKEVDRDTLFDQDPEPEPEGLESPALTNILLLRLYDVNMAILNHLDPDTADRLDEAHAQGLIVTGPPSFGGFADVTEK